MSLWNGEKSWKKDILINEILFYAHIMLCPLENDFHLHYPIWPSQASWPCTKIFAGWSRQKKDHALWREKENDFLTSYITSLKPSKATRAEVQNITKSINKINKVNICQDCKIPRIINIDYTLAEYWRKAVFKNSLTSKHKKKIFFIKCAFKLYLNDAFLPLYTLWLKVVSLWIHKQEKLPLQ